MKARTLGTLSVGVALGFAIATPVVAQSTGPLHTGYDPNAPVGGHYHEGELGEKLMVLETGLRCNCSLWAGRPHVPVPDAMRHVAGLVAAHPAGLGSASGRRDDPGELRRRVRDRRPDVASPEGFNLVGYLLPQSRF